MSKVEDLNLVKLAEDWVDVYCLKINVSKPQRAIVIDFADWLDKFIKGEEMKWKPRL